MTDPAIRVEHLGKQYRIGGPQLRYKTIRDSLVNLVKNPFKVSRNSDENHIWALKDVSFEIQPGEVVGVIGRNGAGKSTLLKVLAHITSPTEGKVEIRGRIGSLLEVGTGFHPELTGRENIYLNGAVLGMKRTEINRKFDEIVDFAEIEKFLDTPVKHYSSGMYMRLAFAVAAHLEPEILLVDEVLAVGDAQFQKKCLGKMGEVAIQGRTVLFVSHNMAAIKGLCNKGFLMSKGGILMNGDIFSIVSGYLSSLNYCSEISHDKSKYNDKLHIYRIRILKNGILSTIFSNLETLVLRIECRVKVPILGAQIAFEFLSEMDECIFSSSNQDLQPEKSLIDVGDYIFECPIDLKMIRHGNYHIKVDSSIPGIEMLDGIDEQLVFEIIDDGSPVLKLGQGRRGIILPILTWDYYKK
jgi:lipopolysaccharide transport system ATP-binding protein